MSASLKISALDQYNQEHKKELLTLALTGNEAVKHMTLLPGIKDKFVLTQLALGNIVKAWSKTFDPVADAIEFKPRTLQVKMGKADLQVFPQELRTVWLGKLMSSGVDPKDLPFEKFIMQYIMEKIAHEINTLCIFHGDGAGNGSDAGKFVDGFKEIIADEILATNLPPVVTGAITNVNAVANLKKVYRALPQAYRSMKVKMYLSWDVYDKYIDDYQASVGAVPYNTSMDKKYLDGSANMCEIVPLSTWGSSQRVVCTPQDNMFIGVDLLSDLEQIRTEYNHRALDIMVDFAIGMQIGLLGALVVNDQA